MYKKIILTIIIIFVPVSVFAGIPSFPMAFWGIVTIDGVEAPAGSTVRVYAGANEVGKVLVQEGGVYGYTEPTKQKLVVIESENLLTFTIETPTYSETAGISDVTYIKFISGDTVQKNLSFSIIENSNSSSGGGGGGSSRNRSSTPVNEEVLPVAEEPTTPTPIVLGVSTFRFTKDLGIDMDNSDVIQLQKLLRDEGFFTYPTNTGYYGLVTQKAVQDYQKFYDIRITGYVGPITRAQLNKGMKTPVVSGGSMSDLEILVLLVDLLKQVQVLQSQLDAQNAA